MFSKTTKTRATTKNFSSNQATLKLKQPVNYGELTFGYPVLSQNTCVN